MSSMTSPAAKACDGHSVGVIIVNAAGQVLIGDRADGAGAAPIAGHVFDAHPSPRAAARAEVFEEVGLTVTHLTEITGGYRANRCRRGDGPDGPGHVWHVYRATATGQLDVDPGSYTGVRWATPDELCMLADRTVAYARGRMQAAAWAERPGIEPVWVFWLHTAGVIHVHRSALDQIERCIEQDLAPKASR